LKQAKKKLLIEQLDNKLLPLTGLFDLYYFENGWINNIRKALNISLRQLSKKLGVTLQNVKQLEEREVSGTISINKLIETADALEMKLVYAFIPKDESLKKLIEKKALIKAKEIVERTSYTMMLEDQENSEERIKWAIKEKTDEIKNEIPKYLWD
jgi:predicted DNA-binding mobile mystery protein A